MLSQRIPEAEIRIGMQFVKLATEGIVKDIFVNRGIVRCANQV